MIKKTRCYFLKIILVALSICITFSGCINVPRLKSRAIILAIGIDISEDDEYIITAQKFSPKGTGASTAIDASKTNDVIMTGKGKSITQAMTEIQSKHGKEIFLGNNSYIIFGKELAKRGIKPVLSFFNSSYEQRPTATVIMSDTTAADVISNQVTQDIMPAFSLGLVTKKSKGIKSVGEITFLQIMSDILSEKRSPYIPIVKVGKNENDENIYEIKGTAIYKGDKFFTEIFAKESQGLLWLKGKIKDNYLVVENGDEIYAIFVNSSNAFKRFKIKDGKPVFDFYIFGTGEIQETIGSNLEWNDEEQVNKVKNIVTAEIEKEITAIINETAVKNGIDSLSLTSLIRQREPKFWKENHKNYEEILKNATYNIHINFNIDKIGLDIDR